MTATDTLVQRLAIAELNADFCHFLDHNEVDALVELFCEDAWYTHGERESRGREAIAVLFGARRDQQLRTARHIQSGLRIDFIDEKTAHGTSVCLTFAADGPPPHPARPLLVADFVDRYARCDDGRWRFRERHIQRIFVDPAHPDPVGLQR